MNDHEIHNGPGVLESILRDTERIGFTMCSEPKTGSLLRALAASKPAGRFLELGTGTGVGMAWLLAGMDADSRLDTVDNDARVQDIARLHLGDDRRVVFHAANAIVASPMKRTISTVDATARMTSSPTMESKDVRFTPLPVSFFSGTAAARLRRRLAPSGSPLTSTSIC